MGLIIALGIGLLAGVIARLVLPGREPGGVFLTILLGLTGSITAWMLGRALGWYAYGEGPGILSSSVGAIAILGIQRVLAGPRGR